MTDDDLAAVADGTLTVRQAAEQFGLSRTKLFELMALEILDWFEGDKGRLITRASLVRYRAEQRARWRGERAHTRGD